MHVPGLWKLLGFVLSRTNPINVSHANATVSVPDSVSSTHVSADL